MHELHLSLLQDDTYCSSGPSDNPRCEDFYEYYDCGSVRITLISKALTSDLSACWRNQANLKENNKSSRRIRVENLTWVDQGVEVDSWVCFMGGRTPGEERVGAEAKPHKASRRPLVWAAKSLPERDILWPGTPSPPSDSLGKLCRVSLRLL